MNFKRELMFGPVSIILVIAMALGIGAIIFAFFGINPLAAYRAVFTGAIVGTHNITESLVITIPLLLTGLGVAFAFKCGVWNIGAEGQLFMGAIGASITALYFQALPRPVHLFLVACGSFVFGGGWGAIAGLLKAKLKTNEILVTLMMNYIAIWIVHYLVYGPMRALEEINPQTAIFPQSAWLPVLVSGSRLHGGLIIGLLAAGFMFWIFKYTRLGYNITVVGSNPRAALFSGINISRTMIIAMFISGGLAGLAGMGEVSGIHHYLRNGIYPISPGYGYAGIGVALLGGLNAWGIVLSALFFGGLLNGTAFLRTAFGLHGHAVFFLVGLIILCLLVRDNIRRKLMQLRPAFQRGGV
ncbi:ABC transporter permease [Chloroflexota bacterium]